MKNFELHVPPGYPRNFAPVSAELDLGGLACHGDMPRSLRGTLLRNGPNPRGAAGSAHWFEGEGMLHAFQFDQGRVSYRNRWIRRTSLAPAGDGAADTGLRDDVGTANTNVLYHGRQMLALEEAHAPVVLEGLGVSETATRDACARLPGPFTAHPKIDPATGEMVFFGYGSPHPLSKGMSYGTLDARGRVTRVEPFDAPYASMVHDFAVTKRHALFPITPLAASLERMTAGGPPFAWEPERGAFLGILRRDQGAASLRWCPAPLGHVFHVMNAWDDGRRVHLDLMQADVPALFTLPDGRPIEGDRDAYLARWTIDLDAQAPCFAQEFLCDIPGEFPRIDDRFSGTAHRHGWFVGDGAQGEPFARIVHIDHQEGRLDVHALPPGDCASEGVFVPRSSHAAEGDGWLLALVYRGRTDTSDLLVFDARHVREGPVATVCLPCRVPNGFHGNWVDASTGWCMQETAARARH